MVGKIKKINYIGKIQKIKNNNKRICDLNNSGLARDKRELFDKFGAQKRRAFVNAVHNSCKFLLKNEKNLSKSLSIGFQKNKNKLRKISKEKIFKKKSVLVKDQIGSGLLSLISKGIEWLISKLAG